MISDAVGYPTQHDDWLKIILVGGVLLLCSFLIVPIFIIYGYQIRVLRCAAEDGQVPPSFGDWGDLAVDGIKSFVIVLGYMIAPHFIIFVGVIISILLGNIGNILGGLIVLLGFVFVLFVGYCLPVALTNFALTDSVGEAFDIPTVANAAFSGEYFVAFILAAVVGFVFNFIGGLISWLFGAGFLVMFYGIIVSSYIVAQGCGPALRQDTGEAFAT